MQSNHNQTKIPPDKTIHRTVLGCAWPTALDYRMQKSKGMKHHAAVRALAYKWIRIIFHLWKNNKTYDEQHYLNQLKSKNSPIIQSLEISWKNKV